MSGYVKLRNDTVVTRKPHKCAWCAEQIDAKSIAEYRVYIFDGDFDHDWMHSECADAMTSMTDENFSFLPGEFARGKTHA